MAIYQQQRDPTILPDDDTKSRTANPDLEIARDGTYTVFSTIFGDSSITEDELTDFKMQLQFCMILLSTSVLCGMCCIYLSGKHDRHKYIDFPHVSKPFPYPISYESVDLWGKDGKLFLTDVR